MTPDRFAADDASPMSVEQALDRLQQRLSPVAAIETIPARRALHRILAEDVVSAVNVPPHDYSAVDGYACRVADLAAGQSLPVVASVAAGHVLDGALPAGASVRILTGAPIPPGADAVAMQEDCRRDGDTVTLPAGLAWGANCRRMGEDLAQGQVALAAGTRLRAQELGVAAAVGRTALRVFRPLKVAVFSTGDEVREPGQPLPPGCIYDTNRSTAAALLEGLGCEVTDLGILPDRFETIRDAIAEAAAAHDLLLTSGGVSVGDEDHVKPAVLANGSLHFWRLAIKPGRPVALGEVNGTAFVGLPGNPVAVMVTFMLLARPLALRLMGATRLEAPRYPLAADFHFAHKPGRREFPRGRLITKDGRLMVAKFASDSSGVLGSMVWADGLIDVAADRGDIAPGDMVDFLPFAEVVR